MIRPSLPAAACLLAPALLTALSAQVLPQQVLPQPPRARDHNPDPRVFETVLVAAPRAVQLVPGAKTNLWTYNGTMPGPTLDVQLGDRVVVHLVNLLPEPTTIHWHGVATPAHMDGSELAQQPVPSSGHFRYEFVANRAGTFWYHPHIHTNEQVEKGLYGALIVRDPQHDKKLGVAPERDLVVFLDDIKLGDDNQLAPFSTDPRAEFVPWKRAEDLVNSRLGTHRLVNGRLLADEGMRGGELQRGLGYRLRFLSASNGNLWRLSVPKDHAVWYGVGSDQGLWNRAEVVVPIGKVKDNRGHHDLDISNPDPAVGVTLTPGDRFESVLVATGDPGADVVVESHDYIKGKHVAFRAPLGDLQFGHDHFDGAEPPGVLLRFRTAAGQREAWSPPDALRHDPVQPIEVEPTREVLPVVFGHMMPDRITGDVMFFLAVDKAKELLAAAHARKVALPMDYLPLAMMKLGPDDGCQVKVGEARCLEVVNFTGSDHNVHLHGFVMQHLGTEFIDLDEPKNNHRLKPLRLADEDTIQIPKRPGLILGRSHTVVRIAVRFDDSGLAPALRRRPDELMAGGLAPGIGRSGGWLLHCHFLEHGSKGMMTFVSVRR
ncbi:MAG: multicopper oxidase domain-containing protein [Planctomycetes bacterium]|nr:multicopper oxidase domain-containing protein [Planctomycetota bacterium]MCB9869058.1 multicopper oxidase domain-containing protein [Planctomycetota bacterium]MCB9888017.1 multicopper oxidase domain-containing protein [Planctomycetota bacterium]